MRSKDCMLKTANNWLKLGKDKAVYYNFLNEYEDAIPEFDPVRKIKAYKDNAKIDADRISLTEEIYQALNKNADINLKSFSRDVLTSFYSISRFPECITENRISSETVTNLHWKNIALSSEDAIKKFVNEIICLDNPNKEDLTTGLITYAKVTYTIGNFVAIPFMVKTADTKPDNGFIKLNPAKNNSLYLETKNYPCLNQPLKVNDQGALFLKWLENQWSTVYDRKLQKYLDCPTFEDWCKWMCLSKDVSYEYSKAFCEYLMIFNGSVNIEHRLIHFAKYLTHVNEAIVLRGNTIYDRLKALQK